MPYIRDPKSMVDLLKDIAYINVDKILKVIDLLLMKSWHRLMSSGKTLLKEQIRL